MIDMANISSHTNLGSDEFSVECWRCHQNFKTSFKSEKEDRGISAEVVVTCTNCGEMNVIVISEKYVQKEEDLVIDASKLEKNHLV